MSARSLLLAMLAALAALVTAPAEAEIRPEPVPPPPGSLLEACFGHDGWSERAPPHKIFGNTWYVGTCGITVLLVKSEAGLVLFDAGPPGAETLVLANIRALGFDPADVRTIFASHEHSDHVGALEALRRATGAEVVAGPFIGNLLRSGQSARDDPQAGDLHPIEPVTVAWSLRDNGSITVGSVTFTVKATPAHSPGSTSWSWQSCEFNSCQTMTYADSASVLAADGYRFSDHPDRVTAVRSGLEAIALLPCGILMTPHPSASDLFERMAYRRLLDPAACGAYADRASAAFERRLADEAEARGGA